MADRTFSIEFKTVSDLEGAARLLQNLQAQRGQAVALGEDYSKVQAKIDRVNGSLNDFAKGGEQNAQQLKNALSKFSGEGAESVLGGMHHNIRAIRTEMSLLGVHAGEVGHLLHLAFSPEFLAIGVVSLGIGKLLEQMKAVKEQMEAVLKLSTAMPVLSNVFEQEAATTREIAVNLATFRTELERITTAAPKVSEALAKDAALMEKMSKATGDLGDAREKTETAALDYLQKRLGLNEAEAKQVQFTLQMETLRLQHEKELHDLQGRRATLEENRDAAGKEKEQLTAQAEALRKLVEHEKANVKNLDADIKTATGTLHAEGAPGEGQFDVNTIALAQAAMMRASKGHPEWRRMSGAQLSGIFTGLEGSVADAERAAAMSGGGVMPQTTQAFQSLEALKQFMTFRQQFERAMETFRGLTGIAGLQGSATEKAGIIQQMENDLKDLEDRARDAGTTIHKVGEDLKTVAQDLEITASKFKSTIGEKAAEGYFKLLSSGVTPFGQPPPIGPMLSKAGYGTNDITAANEAIRSALLLTTGTATNLFPGPTNSPVSRELVPALEKSRQAQEASTNALRSVEIKLQQLNRSSGNLNTAAEQTKGRVDAMRVPGNGG